MASSLNISEIEDPNLFTEDREHARLEVEYLDLEPSER